MTTTTNPPIDLTYLIMRFTAFAIDSVISIIILVISAIIADAGIIFILAIAVLLVLYFVLLDVYWGATIGKKVIGLKVQSEQGSRISIKQSFIRNISKFLLAPAVLDWLIAVITSGPDRNQKFSDRIAGTTVVQTRQIVQATVPPPPPI